MRSDEIRSMQWDQINFERKEIVVGDAKTDAGSGRVIPIAPMQEVALTKYASRYAGKFGPTSPE